MRDRDKVQNYRENRWITFGAIVAARKKAQQIKLVIVSTQPWSRFLIELLIHTPCRVAGKEN